MTQVPRDVVNKSFEYLLAVSPNNEKMSEVRIEELEQLGNLWKVVLSYDVVGNFAFEKNRLYKEFSVSDETGEVLSMKIKTL